MAATAGSTIGRGAWGLAEVIGPVAGGGAVAGFEQDGGTARTAALEIHLAAAADVHEPGQVCGRGMGDRRSGGEEKGNEEGSANGHDVCLHPGSGCCPRSTPETLSRTTLPQYRAAIEIVISRGG